MHHLGKERLHEKLLQVRDQQGAPSHRKGGLGNEDLQFQDSSKPKTFRNIRHPNMRTKKVGRRTTGRIFNFDSSHSGSSSRGSSKPSDSIPSPVGIAWAGAIQTYGWGAYPTFERTAKLFNSAGNNSNITFPETNAVVPSGTSSSSPVPSSYRHTCFSPAGTVRPYRVVTLGGFKSYRAASMCHR